MSVVDIDRCASEECIQSIFLQERLHCNSCVQFILNKKYFLAVEKIHYLRGVISGTSSKMSGI